MENAGALRYFLMLEMPDMAQGPEVQVDLSGMRHPLAAAETEILLDGLTCPGRAGASPVISLFKAQIPLRKTGQDFQCASSP